jgi:hypothetical protein
VEEEEEADAGVLLVSSVLLVLLVLPWLESFKVAVEDEVHAAHASDQQSANELNTLPSPRPPESVAVPPNVVVEDDEADDGDDDAAEATDATDSAPMAGAVSNEHRTV